MHQISFLPYFPTPKPIDEKFGRVHLFSFWEHKNRYIADSTLREKIESIFSINLLRDKARRSKGDKSLLARLL